MRTQRRAGLNEAMTAELRSLVAAVDRDEKRERAASRRDPFEVQDHGWDEAREHRHIA